MIDIDQRPIGRTPRSNPATYIKVFDEIRQLLQPRLPEARVPRLQAGPLLLQREGRPLRGLRRATACGRSRCTSSPTSSCACEECQGKRYNDATLRVQYKTATRSRTCSSMSGARGAGAVRERALRRSPAAALLRARSASTTSTSASRPHPVGRGGPAHQARPRAVQARHGAHPLHPRRAHHRPPLRRRSRSCSAVLQRARRRGQHRRGHRAQPRRHQAADWIVDLGPEGGPKGGEIVAQGTPEQVAKAKGSFTGRYLKPLLAAPARSRSKGRRRA